MSNVWINSKEPRLLLTLVLSVLSDVHFHCEAACEEVVGVRLTCVWWANRDSNPGPSGYEPDALTN